MSAADLGSTSRIGDGEARIRNVLQRAVIRRIEGRHAEQPARGDMGDADDHAAMVVEFEFGADFGILELVELGILDGDEGVLAVNILDRAAEQRRSAEQARVVKSQHVGGLVGPIAQLQERRAGIQRHRVLDARNAPDLVEHVIRQRDGIGDRLDRRIHHPDRGADIKDGGGGAGENSGEQRGHLDHQEDGERDPDEQRGVLCAVVDQQLIRDMQYSTHRRRPGLQSIGMARHNAWVSLRGQ